MSEVKIGGGFTTCFGLVTNQMNLLKMCYERFHKYKGEYHLENTSSIKYVIRNKSLYTRIRLIKSSLVVLYLFYVY